MSDAPDEDESNPFDALASEIDIDEDPEVLFEQAFDDASAEVVDPETLWERLERGSAPSVPEPGEGTATDVVSKRSYCESCQYMRPPPRVECTHEGTEIVEYVDTDHVRVRNCPIVARRTNVDRE